MQAPPKHRSSRSSRSSGRLKVVGILTGIVVVGAIVAGAVVLSQPQGHQGRQGSESPSLSSGPSPAATNGATSLAGKVLKPPAHQLYWGDFRSDAPDDPKTIESLRHEVGRWPAIQMWFQSWADSPSFDTSGANWLRANGIVPMITWEAWKPSTGSKQVAADQPRYALRRIIAGAFDSYITHYAESIKAYGGPVMLRLFHEMNGTWYPWGGTVNGNTPGDFIAAWRHVHDIFQHVGATNVTWVWSVNNIPHPQDNAVKNYWPGQRYVDWIGLSGYNWGPTQSWSRWQDFDSVYSARYKDLVRYHKPIVLAEIAAPEVGGNKANWIRDSFQAMRSRYPLIAALVWFDKDSQSVDWSISSSPESLAAFQAEIKGSNVLSAPAALSSASQA